MNKKWILNGSVDSDIVESLSRAINVNRTLASILVSRGIHSYEEAHGFFRPDLEGLHDPFEMADMSKAVNRLCNAVAHEEHIVVYGDYDVDGTTSVALVYMFLRQFTENLTYYIPDRYDEGYGISEKGVRWAAEEEGAGLMIALDCGIRAIEQIDLANSLGLDVIICDHHKPGDILPKALAVLDPKRADCPYPFDELSGCGVGFKLLQGFSDQNSVPYERLFRYLDLLAVSIGADIVPIVGENRILAYHGLKKLNTNPLPGLAALIEISGRKKQLSITDVVFYLGPRINAAGRLSHARESVRLLLAQSEDEVKTFADSLNEHNQNRKEHDKRITEEAIEMIEKEYRDARSTVLYQEGWHKGVIGIVASRCIEQYYRPTIILTRSGEEVTGSARSVHDFDIHEAIASCSDLLTRFGGHKYAAGLSMPPEKVESFRDAFEKRVSSTLTEDQLQPQLRIDQEISFSTISFKVLDILDQMAPFGPGNLQPVFLGRRLYIKNPIRLINDEHVKMIVYQEGERIGYEAIGFRLADSIPDIQPGYFFNMAFQLGMNEYLGNKSTQLVIKDIKLDF